MIKLFKWIFGLFFLLASISGIILILGFNWIVKTGLEYVGPKVTLTDVSIGSSNSSLTAGVIQLNSVVLSNLQGFHDPVACKIRDVKISIDLPSLIYKKIIVQEIVIDTPEIFYEKDSKSNNINRIFDNIRSFIKGTRQLTEGQEKTIQKKLQINSFVVKNGVVTTRIPLINDKKIVTSLQEIHLKDIGTSPNDKTVYEAVDIILKTLNDSISTAIYAPIREIGKEAQELIDKIKGLFQNE